MPEIAKSVIVSSPSPSAAPPRVETRPTGEGLGCLVTVPRGARTPRSAGQVAPLSLFTNPLFRPRRCALGILIDARPSLRQNTAYELLSLDDLVHPGSGDAEQACYCRLRHPDMGQQTDRKVSHGCYRILAIDTAVKPRYTACLGRTRPLRHRRKNGRQTAGQLHHRALGRGQV